MLYSLFSHICTNVLQLLYDDEAFVHNVWSSRISRQAQNNEGHCIWYGTCGDCVPQHADYNIAYNGPPKAVNSDDIQVLNEVCPELFENLGEEANHKKHVNLDLMYNNNTILLRCE